MSEQAAVDVDGYQIGTVASLTGLDPHTIRAWERRHGAVRPRRTPGGTRLYDDMDVVRLQLLKALTECGEPIRTAALLSDEELRSRLERLAGLGLGRQPAKPDRDADANASAGADVNAGSGADVNAGAGADVRARRLALLAPGIRAQLTANPQGLAGFDLALDAAQPEELREALRFQPCSLLLVELDALGPDPLATVDALLAAAGEAVAVIVYTFARRELLARLGSRGAKLVRAPVRLEVLRRTLFDLVMFEWARRRTAGTASSEAEPQPVPERLFEDAQLARLAEITSGVDCECPNHLSALVSSLAAFEAYSAHCESRDPGDAALHRRLHEGAGRARAALESLLAALCDHDGIVV